MKPPPASDRSPLASGWALAITLLSTVLLLGCGRREPPRPAPQEAVETGVRFVSIHGRVQVKKAGTLAWVNASLAMVLHKDDLVQTLANSAAKLRFTDGTETDVRPNSMTWILESSHDPVTAQPHVGLGIQSGEADFHAGPQAGSRKIKTPTGSAVPERGAEGDARVAADGTSAFRMFEGKASVDSASGQQAQIGPNEGIQIDARGQAGQKLLLPSIPTLAAPPDRSEASHPDLSQATTKLTWNGVMGARSYRVVVDATSDFAIPTVDRRVDQATQLELRGMEAGTYYWKVAAVDASGVEGGFSSSWCFSLLENRSSVLKPPTVLLDLIELRGTQLHVSGRTEPGTTVTVNGERIPIQRDGSFNEHVVLDKSAAVVSIRATSATGAVTEQRLPIVPAK